MEGVDNSLNLKKWEELEVLRTQLQNEVQTFVPHWRDLSDFILPRRTRFFTTDVNKGEKRNTKIIDSTATYASTTLRSGMMSGVTSPARPWFRLTIPNKTLAESGAVKGWLHETTERMRDIFIRSNLYNVLPTCYGDLGVFATGCIFQEEDFDTVTRFYSFPLGSFKIANDAKLKVSTFSRDFMMTVGQVVEKFGTDRLTGKVDLDIFSNYIKEAYIKKQTQQWIEVSHVIRPNPNYDPKRFGPQFKKYESTYYEAGRSSATKYDRDGARGKFLRESGYDYFPVLAPRWEVTGEDPYGSNCPGMTALGDTKQLQHGENRVMQALDKMVKPPLIGSTSLQNKKVSILPGDVTFDDSRENNRLKPIFEVRYPIQEAEGKQEQVRQRISKAFYEDLFLMLAHSDRRQITATEVDARTEEKLLALGPVLEQLNQDLLDPLIENTFALMDRQGLIPEPPAEIAGQPMKVEYISIMAQAQKLVGLGGLERFTAYLTNLATVDPAVLDKVSRDQMVDVYGDMTGIQPGIVIPDEEAFMTRQQRAQQEAAIAQQEAMAQAAQTGKVLSETETSGGNALDELRAQADAGQLVEGA